MTHYCLTLGGMNGGKKDRMTTALRSYASTGGRVQMVVPYPQSGSAKSIPTGVETLNDIIRELIGKGHTVEILAHSQGAEVWSEWAEKYAGRPDAPRPDQITNVILIGNPRRRYGGRGVGSLSWDWSKITATPVTQYRTLDIARLEDIWANADGWGLKKPPKRVTILAQLLGKKDPHLFYDDVAIENCSLRLTDGRTSYLVHV